jgi:hypothetical protein
MTFMDPVSRLQRMSALIIFFALATSAQAKHYWYALAAGSELPSSPTSIDYSIVLGTETLIASSSPLPTSKQLRLAATFEQKVAIETIRTLSHSCTEHAHFDVAAIIGGFDLIIRQTNQLVEDPLLQRIPANRSVAQVVDLRQYRLPSRSTVQDLVALVNPQRWFDSLQSLAAINRNSYSPFLQSAKTEIQVNFSNAGLSTSEFFFELSNITSCTPTPAPVQLPNIIGTKPGLLRPNEWVVIGAHYDSRNPGRCDGINAPQPGANDNASGCAGVMELARVFSGVQTDRTMLFMCFSGEEQGLVGSRRYVDSLVANGDISKVKLMLNMDMIGHDVDGTLPARIETRTPAIMTAFATAAATYAPELRIITSTTPNGGSDHFYFQQANVPAVVTWENGASVYPHYHQTTDIPANMTRAREMAGGILKMNVAALYDAAMVVPTGDRFLRSGFEDL